MVVAHRRSGRCICVADTYPRQPGIDVLHYVFRVMVNDETDEISGETTVHVRFLQDKVTGFSLDLASAEAGKGMVVSAVAAAGTPVCFKREDDRLELTVDPPAKIEERRRFDVSYRGVPRRACGLARTAMASVRFSARTGPTRPGTGCRPWTTRPTRRPASSSITAPARYQVVANGLLQEEHDLGDGRRLTHWKQSVPIATWLNAVGVAQFSAHHAGHRQGRAAGELGLSSESRSDQSRHSKHQPAASSSFTREHVGPYPYEKLAGVQAAGIGRRHRARQRDLLRRAIRLRARHHRPGRRTKSPTSGSATPSPSATGTTSGLAKALRPISRCCSPSTTPAATRSWRD